MATCCHRLARAGAGSQDGAMGQNTNPNARTDAAPGTFVLGGDLPVRRIGLGAMRLAQSTFDGPVRSAAEGVAVLRRAVELGVDHIDTADFYGPPQLRANEQMAHALHPYPDDLVIATKVGPIRDEQGFPSREATPEQLRGLVQQNLRDLRLDRLDLVYLRVGGMGPVGGVSIAERFGAMARLRDEGLIRHLGVSNVDLAQFEEALAIAPVAAVQNHFNVQHQGDVELLRRCADRGIAFVPFFPLGGGFQPLDAPVVAQVAARHGATPAQIAQAWLLQTSANLLLIPGTGSLEHLEENVAAGDIVLTDEELTALT
jgi:aryl-alcohol dehydrogenase-like predicted oxidoreductase